MKKLLYLITILTVSFASGQDYKGVVDSYLNNNRAQLNFQAQDFAETSIASHSFSKSMNLENVYASQEFQGIQIFNSTSSFAIKNNLVVNANLSFVKNISQKINTVTPAINPQTAITKAANTLGLSSPVGLNLIETISGREFVYSNGGISLNEIPVKLVFQPTQDNTLRLAWDLSIYVLDASHYYSVRIDAVTGELISKNDWVVSCDFETTNPNIISNKEEKSVLFPQKENITISPMGTATYRVFPLPLESPNHGDEALVSDPADPNASPFGWHDTNGVVGAEFTITRGNNVLAQDDRNGNNGLGASPDGGVTLNFDFPFNFEASPVNMLDASTVNLFYWNNLMHDVWYQYGFDEASGNFQQNNYGNSGNGNDYVNADAQDGAGINNANFGTPPDGLNPRMQMFLWSASGPAGTPLTINNGALAGDYPGETANFGDPLPTSPLTADLGLVIDNNAGVSTDANDACDPIINGLTLSGKIAVLRRGECEFGFKVLSAQNEGAVAVIVVNNVAGAPIPMGPGANGASVTIPSIMVNQADGEAIITALLNGDTISASLVDAGPYEKDGDLDNGIVAHEYGHGISNRLTGGPSNSNCLQNDEQMGEGWSDFFTLMMTIEPGDQAADRRGIATYVTGQSVTGTGIRPRAYSTDFNINNFTYGNTNSSSLPAPHGVGFVWATMLWDLNWALINEYGFDTDFYNGSGGNNIAMQLVIDGLKLQNCSPGFVDGRDAILQADQNANGGANRCLIWNVFARRGLGLSAQQGSPFSRFDQTEAFDVPTDCVLGINDNGSINNNFIIYPNPSTGIINIKSVVDAGDVNISIYDINGRKVFTQDITLTNTVNINTGNLKTGVYIIQINGSEYSQTAKLLIE